MKNVKVTGKAAAAHGEAVAAFPAELQPMKFSATQVFSRRETELPWRRMPATSHVRESTAAAPGRRTWRDRRQAPWAPAATLQGAGESQAWCAERRTHVLSRTKQSSACSRQHSLKLYKNFPLLKLIQYPDPFKLSRHAERSKCRGRREVWRRRPQCRGVIVTLRHTGPVPGSTDFLSAGFEEETVYHFEIQKSHL